jgi:protein-glutamine gamma-glutamyltransferase
MVKIKAVLTALTLCIALIGYLPLQPYLDMSARLFFPASLLVAFYLERTQRALPAKLLTPLSIALFLYYGAGFSMNNILRVTADLLVVFLGIRLLGERSGRHYLQVFGLSLFCLASSSLYNLTAVFMLYLLLLLFLVAVSLVVLTFHNQDPEIALKKPEAKKVLTVSTLMPVASLPILLVLFVLLPRTQFPLWDFMNQQGAKVTGFSDTVRPGSSASVAEVKSVVLRVMSPKVPDDKLYWRGIVLNGFSGDDWVRVSTPEEKSLVGKGRGVHQVIYPEPTATPYLLGLNVPRQLAGIRAEAYRDVVYASARPLDKRIKYEVDSVLSDTIPVKGGIDRNFYLTLPATVSERMRGVGRELSRPGLTVQDKLDRLQKFFETQRLSYATTGLPTGGNPLDSFLFVSKRGHCELFASSAATLLRLAGVPSRLVGGYHGGSYNAMGGYYLVTEDMAHVWVEAYDEARGWVSVDPSAWSVGFARNPGVGRELRTYIDALGFFWNKAVINYDLQTQIALITAAGSKARNLRMPTELWKPALGGVLLLLAVATLVVLYRQRPRSSQERLLKRFLRAVRRLYPATATDRTGLFELADRVRDPNVNEFVAIYGRALYGDRHLTPEEAERLKEIIRNLRQHHP